MGYEITVTIVQFALPHLQSNLKLLMEWVSSPFLEFLRSFEVFCLGPQVHCAIRLFKKLNVLLYSVICSVAFYNSL